ncbi:EAL domain-containing protein [Bradyrhizobium sp. U87765 SZCCT0131]|uniref:putative bifunctional diguanylate cyclase/phosphodiesterase n=1 Tax=unclassified Bradyrhizobium TaxID=2631580 RepID=UPI001BA581B2|nr:MULTISPECIES: EAL domain-containing protein [unclassified Bradyrhizobium]MBR1218933.1 EAL domain-containing protein [Bradyrhizobium sp. U87765 SZCCT0131]MBR1261584.1 EAL domain-containing protein [Bradyrhizobium sp. U87765 SZCCT0134]MBR1306563.1 EAL domain-containing protein [Bradyrhizobium sp. U87765 SZCCT0110]MBR1317366.1 EAL domain-containing protein [Bradyrhizobium sp. U87765 SZCCT0109]MBR1351068.1 EAL domain-containing protein [Bradyrhizobium sp. U87765 SZCCT0048]
MRTPSRVDVSKLLAGDLAAFGGPQADEDAAGAIRAEQVALVLRHAPGIMLANAGNALVLVLALWTTPLRWPAALWSSAVIGTVLLTLLKGRGSWRITKPTSVSRRTIHRLVRNAFILGCVWALLPLYFFAGAGQGGQLVITCLCAGMLAGGALAFATIPVAAVGFIGPIFLGAVVSLGRIGDFISLLMVALILLYVGVLLRGVFAYAFEFSASLVRQIETAKAVRQDPLTRLPNRFAFNERLDACLARLLPGGAEFAILLLDLDRFKQINDQYGHPVGDGFLVEVAARLRRCTGEGDFAARIGGDEFALIATGLTKPEDALAIAERIVAAFADPFRIDEREIAGATSIGIVLAPRDGTTANDLFKHVDMALYRAKRAGSGTIEFFAPGDDIAARERRALVRDLEQAVARGELALVYQPFLDLRTGRIAGVEALARWHHPVRGLVSPAEFIPIAEETGLIHGIGDWVIREACTTLARWPQDIRVAVNVSAVQLQNTGILQTAVRALADAGVAPHRLEIEMTESMLLSKSGAAPSVLDALLALGVTLALDDFGTGFSSLTYLRKLPFSRIKIDQSFIRDMLTRPDCAAIVRSVIGLAQDLRIGVVAEGVETTPQLDALRDAGCDEVQGYLIGRPMPAAEVSALLTADRPKTGHAA